MRPDSADNTSMKKSENHFPLLYGLAVLLFVILIAAQGFLQQV